MWDEDYSNDGYRCTSYFDKRYARQSYKGLDGHLHMESDQEWQKRIQQLDAEKAYQAKKEREEARKAELLRKQEAERLAQEKAKRLPQGKYIIDGETISIDDNAVYGNGDYMFPMSNKIKTIDDLTEIVRLYYQYGCE